MEYQAYRVLSGREAMEPDKRPNNAAWAYTNKQHFFDCFILYYLSLLNDIRFIVIINMTDADAIATPVLISMLEDERAKLKEAEKKLELLRSTIRKVSLLLVGPPGANIGHIARRDQRNRGGEVETDREGLEIYYKIEEEDLLRDHDTRVCKYWDDDYLQYFMFTHGCTYTAEELQNFQVRFGDSFVTHLISDGELKNLWFDGRGTPSKSTLVQFSLRVDVDLGDSNDSVIIAEVILVRDDGHDYGNNEPRLELREIPTEALERLAGIPLGSMWGQGQQVDNHYWTLPQFASLQIDTLEETLGYRLRYEILEVQIPKRVVRHKCHLL